jgi:signal transduction histidine kinase
MESLFRYQHRLLADVSHDLRTPLTAMRGTVDLMRHMGEVDM